MEEVSPISTAGRPESESSFAGLRGLRGEEWLAEGYHLSDGLSSSEEHWLFGFWIEEQASKDQAPSRVR